MRNVNQNNLNNLHDVVGKGLNPVNPVDPVAGQERSIGTRQCDDIMSCDMGEVW